MKLLLATNNKHKLEELRAILQGLDDYLEILSLSDLGDLSLEVEETGSTLEENAYLKARAFYELTGMACVADDTGLEVQALNGAPGVHTARFAGDNATYDDNVSLLLERLQGVADDQRNAVFRTVICYVDDQRSLFAEGACVGRIAQQRSGTGGFGYDPVFVPENHTASFAELGAELKNSISHRARALDAFAKRFAPLRNDESALVKGSTTVNEASDNSTDDHYEGGHRHRTLLCRAAVYAALNQQFELQACVHEYCDHEYDLQHMYEALLQVYLFAGFPASIEALGSMRSVLEQRGISWYADDSEVYDVRNFEKRGTKACQNIYTGVYTAMRERVLSLSAHLDQWMIVEGYGKVLARPQLDLVSRELINVAVLSVSSWSRQLYSHLRGALNVDADAQMCAEILGWSASFCSKEVAAEGQKVWQSVLRSSSNSNENTSSNSN